MAKDGLLGRIRGNAEWDAMKVLAMSVKPAAVSLVYWILTRIRNVHVDWIGILILFILCFIAMALILPAGVGREPVQQVATQKDDPTPVVGKTFRSEIVDIDGKNFIDCSFFHVRLRYRGSALFGFSHCSFNNTSPMTEREDLTGVVVLLKTLGFLPNMPILGPDNKPLSNIEETRRSS